MAAILLLETATEVCSVALSSDGSVVSFNERSEGFRHSELLTVLTEKTLMEWGHGPAHLDAVCISSGPGSYTGLRIGVSVAKGLCYALDIPLIAISTLSSLAHHVAFLPVTAGKEPLCLFPLLDARRMEVYTARFGPQGEQLSPVEALIVNDQTFAQDLENGPVLFFGNGAPKCRAIITHPNAVFINDLHASARFMSSPAYEKFLRKQFEDVPYFEPFYLKDFVATVPKNKVF